MRGWQSGTATNRIRSPRGRPPMRSLISLYLVIGIVLLVLGFFATGPCPEKNDSWVSNTVFILAWPVADERGEPGDRGAARAVERRQHRPLGRNAGRARRVVQRRQRLRQFAVGRAALDRQCALRHRRQHPFRRQDLERQRRLA